MNVSEKMMAALKGSRAMRMLLIRDKNKAVWSAVLSSPHLSDADLEEIAQMPDVHPDVLRELTKYRQVMKRPEICIRLLMNPRTPEDVAQKLLGRLSNDTSKESAATRDSPQNFGPEPARCASAASD